MVDERLEMPWYCSILLHSCSLSSLWCCSAHSLQARCAAVHSAAARRCWLSLPLRMPCVDSSSHFQANLGRVVESVKSIVAPEVDVVNHETGPLFKMSENVVLGGIRGMQQESSSTFRVYAQTSSLPRL